MPCGKLNASNSFAATIGANFGAKDQSPPTTRRSIPFSAKFSTADPLLSPIPHPYQTSNAFG